MQVRINCEDPQNNFSPNSGMITRYISPGGPGVRLDSCVTAGYEFPSQLRFGGRASHRLRQSWIKVVDTHGAGPA